MSKNSRAFDAMIDDLDELSDDLIEALLEADDDILKDIEATHRAKQSPDGKPWKARKEAYPWPINNKSGHLLNSYETTTNKNKQTLTIQNTAAYAVHVDKVRPLLTTSDIPDKWYKDLEEALDDFVDDWNKKK